MVPVYQLSDKNMVRSSGRLCKPQPQSLAVLFVPKAWKNFLDHSSRDRELQAHRFGEKLFEGGSPLFIVLRASQSLEADD